jgi:hypothetical protein
VSMHVHVHVLTAETNITDEWLVFLFHVKMVPGLITDLKDSYSD